MVSAVMRPLSDHTNGSNHNTLIHHRSPSKEPEYIYAERVPAGRNFPCSEYYVNPSRNARTKIDSQHVRTQPPLITSKEAIKRLNHVLDDAMAFFTDLQHSFESETSQLTYLDEGVLNYIWQDKLRRDTNFISHENQYNDNVDPNRVPSQGVHNMLKQLNTYLNAAVDATIYETSRSAGDNRTLAEKLTRMAGDIEGSRGKVTKNRQELDVLMTDLEMLQVLLKRHGAESSSSNNGGGSNVGKGGRIRMLPRRGSSYEQPSVVDEGEDEEGGSVTETVATDSGFQDGSGSEGSTDWKEEKVQVETECDPQGIHELD